MVKNKTQQGFATIEILIASAILVVVFGAVVMLILGAQKVSLDTQLAHAGELLAQKSLEEARNDSLLDFDVNQSDEYDVSSDGITYHVKRTDVMALCYKTITVDVDWQFEGRSPSISLTSQVTNPQEAFAQGGGCPISGPQGTNPWEQCVSDHSADIQPAGSQAQDLDVFNINSTTYLAIAAQHSDDTSHDLWLYTTSPSGFTFKTSLDLVEKEGLSALAVARHTDGVWYIFAAKNKTPQNPEPHQLRIISLADPNTPVQVAPTLAFTGNNDAKDVIYYDSFVYLAVGNTVYKINPTTQAIAGSLNLGASVNKLKANDNFLYAATADNNGELKIVNTNSMTLAGSFPAQGNEDGTAVYVLGDTVYLGRERSQNNPDFYVLNVAVPASVQSLGSKNLNHTSQSYIIDIVVTENLAFIGSTKEEFEVWNVEDPLNIVKNCSPSNTVAQVAAGLDLHNNVVYGAIRSNQAVRRYIDSNNPPQ